ncbi:Vat family streptogramin A O-acetyltransferase [Hydrogenovibrio sp. JE_KL2]|uniref:Vat family streptogramin A O-acetyltransferase n=1 Tax=Hydrogenovibrio sp. JE_KL2 TaxID=2651188 RepID=UPI00128B55B9|nr:Vat family streptogramin A O-acetyltransferase [Hydrogenovibrio sp. JE_KL2]MPQ76316.1 Vat family streptogramin A O-acetyltransferase [Hydrogenovibrio sp. JE_KL2]
MFGPNPNDKEPMKGFPQVGFLKNFITRDNIEVGDYTYYDDLGGPENFEKNVLYHYPFIGDKLIIGKFCAIATNVKFIMNGANHKMSGLSTYPFGIFGQDWEAAIPKPEGLPFKGNTEIGNDVWIGYNATIMPGVKIGHGVIIAAESVVVKNIPPYAIVGGNPAQVVRMRFNQDEIDKLIDIAWWDWPVEKITKNLSAITGGDLSVLQKVT